MYKTLDRNELFQGSAVPEWATAAARFKGHWYFEESLEQADGARFQRVASESVSKYGGGAIKGFTEAVLFTPMVEQDDPLPPAPESVLYIGLQQHVHRRLQVKVFKSADSGSVVDLHIGGGMLGDGKSCVLAPDAALQLAHDLNRMANEIKRREKQQERKTTLSPAIAHPYGE